MPLNLFWFKEQTLYPSREVARRWNRTNEGIKKRYGGCFRPNVDSAASPNYSGFYQIGEILKSMIETTKRITPFDAMNRRDRTFISKSGLDIEFTTAQTDRYTLGVPFNPDRLDNITEKQS